MNEMTLAQAREILHAEMNDGTKCPCCEQNVKVYRRALNASMARSLIWLVCFCKNAPRWVNVPKDAPKWLQRSRELPKLAYWGMIVSRPNTDDPSKRCSGEWAPTQRGYDFAHGEIAVPSHVGVYNGTVRYYSEKLTTIQAALGKAFDYHELMRGE